MGHPIGFYEVLATNKKIKELGAKVEMNEHGFMTVKLNEDRIGFNWSYRNQKLSVHPSRSWAAVRNTKYAKPTPAFVKRIIKHLEIFAKHQADEAEWERKQKEAKDFALENKIRPLVDKYGEYFRLDYANRPYLTMDGYADLPVEESKETVTMGLGGQRARVPLSMAIPFLQEVQTYYLLTGE